MSSNRLMYDACETKQRINESANPLQYMLNPIRYENCDKCRMELGIIGGTSVSHIQGNLVDLETDLMGITRKASLCPTKKYQSPCPKGDMNNCHPKEIKINNLGNQTEQVLNTNMVHLPSCQMIRYKPVPLPNDMPEFSCKKF